MDLSALPTVIGIILLLAALGLLKPLRQLFGGLGEDVEKLNRVKEMLVNEWHLDAEVAHAKKNIKTHTKIEALGEVRSYEDNMKLLKRKVKEDEE